MTLGLIVLASLAAVVSSTLRWNRYLIARAEGLEVARTVWVVLDQELRDGRFGRDWTLDEAGVLHLRAFRGLGRVCGAADGRWVVAYRGWRLPDVERDSLLVLGSDARWRASSLESVHSQPSADGCGADGRDATLRMGWSDTETVAPIVIRVFERGSYHLADRAFRYRSGRGGRQPLTVERVAESSHFGVVGGALQVTLDVAATGDRPGPGRLVWRVGEVPAGR